MNKSRMKFINDLTKLIASLKRDLPQDGMEVTIGVDDKGWAFQTGSMQFFGDVYFYSNWGMGTLTYDMPAGDFARELVEDLENNGDAERYFYDDEEGD